MRISVGSSDVCSSDLFWIRLFSVFSKLMFQDLCCRRDYLRQSMNIHAIELAAGDIQSGKTEDDKISLNPVVLSQYQREILNSGHVLTFQRKLIIMFSDLFDLATSKIDKVSCRERVCQYV